jgi:hypothetical protein
MIAYGKTLLDNLLIERVTKRWFASGLLSVEQMATIIKKYPGKNYDPNIFVRIGLFLFMCFLIGAAMGFYSLFTMSAMLDGGNEENYAMFTCFLFAGFCFFILERFIKKKAWYGNGMDDALLYCGLIYICSFICLAMSNSLKDENAFLIVCFAFLPFLLAATLRYLDRITALASIICFYCISFLVTMKMGNVAKFIMPFVFMGLSAGIYFLSKIHLQNPRAIHYRGCLKVAKAAALIVFYISGNYFVIRESSVEFFELDLTSGQDIPMAAIFYTFTALVPLAYLFFGLKNKDKLMVWVALLLTAAAVLTFKYYFSLGHPEVTLTLAGLVMIALAYGSIKYLATDKYGITFKDDPNEDNFLKSNAEALVIAQSFGTHAQPTDTGVDVGGGQFGGGGSGNKF